MADEVMKKLKQHDEQLETIATTVLDNNKRLDNIDEKLDNFVTKEDHQEVMGALDTIIGLPEKKDQELTFMGERVKRVESKAEKNTTDVQKIKPLV